MDQSEEAKIGEMTSPHIGLSMPILETAEGGTSELHSDAVLREEAYRGIKKAFDQAELKKQQKMQCVKNFDMESSDEEESIPGMITNWKLSRSNSPEIVVSQSLPDEERFSTIPETPALSRRQRNLPAAEGRPIAKTPPSAMNTPRVMTMEEYDTCLMCSPVSTQVPKFISPVDVTVTTSAPSVELMSPSQELLSSGGQIFSDEMSTDGSSVGQSSYSSSSRLVMDLDSELRHAQGGRRRHYVRQEGRKRCAVLVKQNPRSYMLLKDLAEEFNLLDRPYTEDDAFEMFMTRYPDCDKEAMFMFISAYMMKAPDSTSQL
jgi:hypothetical protein